ncbi:MAG: ATP-binding cassette domain-containing protein [Candidatus Eisenbacteria sp.]|nr:ATP-binding cassette domain-containing protein [Candidatus Eisenbacteria bacterium]
MNQLRIEGLRYHGWGPIELTIGPAECVCLFGASGSGKTLLLRAIADLDPHDGFLFLNELECNDIPAPQWRRRVGMLPAESQWWHDDVSGHFSTPDKRRLQDLDLDQDILTWQVGRLSTGERQRLALARLLNTRPQALLLDEPTASLDPESTRCAEATIAAYRAETGAPVLWVTHDQQQAQRVACRSYRMNEGNITLQVHT